MPSFEQHITSMGKLPTLPGIAMRILDAVRKEDTGVKEIGKILATDPPLSVEVLKAINSPLYGLSTKITSVFHAVNMLGINTVKNLALGFSLVKSYNKEKNNGFDYALFWKCSMVGAVSSRLIASRICPHLTEDAFFLGLIHNIGSLVLLGCMPRQYPLVTKEIQTSGCGFHEAESQVLGFNHCEVGSYLVRSWGLPETFSIPITHHHQTQDPPDVANEILWLTRVLRLASLFIDLFHGTDKSLSLNRIDKLVEAYQWQQKIDIDTIGKEIHDQAHQVFPMFEIDIRDGDGYIRILESARHELISLSEDMLSTLMQQKQQLERLREQATRDSMTNLHNYQHFHELMERELNRAYRYHLPLTLIFGDIDHFKSVNDTLGHLAGDHAIKVVARHLKRQLRFSDLVARYGGEEFAILLPGEALETALPVAERIRQTLEKLEIEWEKCIIPLTMSFGVAAFTPETPVSGAELMNRADNALYQAKRKGRNRCCVHEAL